MVFAAVSILCVFQLLPNRQVTFRLMRCCSQVISWVCVGLPSASTGILSSPWRLDGLLESERDVPAGKQHLPAPVIPPAVFTMLFAGRLETARYILVIPS